MGEDRDGIMKYYDTGEVWIKGKRRPFLSYREIKKGKNKGKIELYLLKNKIIVSANDVERYPKEGTNAL